MYSVRRFSTTLSLEEREYNIASDLYHSGLGRTSKKIIGRVRRNLGAGVERLAINNDAKMYDLNELNKILTVPAPPRMTRRLVREASSRNSIVMGNISDESEIFTPRSFDKVALNNLKINSLKDDISKKDKVASLVAYKGLSSGKNLISYPRNGNTPAGIDDLAHEIGHIDNGMSKNAIKRKIHEKAGEYRPTMALGFKGSGKGLLSSLKNYLKGETIVSEESMASKKGLELLRKNGASSEVLDKSKKSLDNSLETYKLGRNNMILYPIRNLIQIPSRVERLDLGSAGLGNNIPASNFHELGKVMNKPGFIKPLNYDSRNLKK